MKKKIGIIGFGNMGSAIAERAKEEYLVFVFDKDKNKTAGLKDITVADNIIDLVNPCEVIILAIKPQDFDIVLKEIKGHVLDKLIISIAAGITTSRIEGILGKARVIRTMPNIGARIGRSVTCICKGSLAAQEDLEEANRLFMHIGEVLDLNENMLDAATAVSGSGPGYYFYAIESHPDEYKNNHKKFHEDFILSLSEAARAIGFGRESAQFLARWTVVYSDLLFKESGISAAELKKQVTSKGGTTEAALKILEKNGSLTLAVQAALMKAKELSGG